MKHLGTLERAEEMGELVRERGEEMVPTIPGALVCAQHKKVQQHSSHHCGFPHADHYTSNEQVPSHTLRVKLACTAKGTYTPSSTSHTTTH